MNDTELKCPNCERQLEENVKFCPECGKEIKKSEVRSSQANSMQILESFKKNPFFYVSAALCVLAILTLFSEWIPIKTTSSDLRYILDAHDGTLLGFVQYGLKCFEAIPNYSSMHSETANKLAGTGMACMYSTVMIVTGIFYGIALYRMLGVRSDKKAYHRRGVLGFVSKVSVFAIVAFILQVIIWIIASGWKFSLIFDFSGAAYAYILFAVAIHIIAQKGIVQPISEAVN